MKYILTLTLLIISMLPASAVKKFEANPINIAAMMVQRTDSAQIASTCEYYGFVYQGVEDGYVVMKRTNGSEIKFTFNDNGTKQKYPIIVVKTKDDHKEIDTRLKELGFDRKGSIYEIKRNQYSRYITQCSVGPHHTLTFRRFNNQYLNNLKQ